MASIMAAERKRPMRTRIASSIARTSRTMRASSLGYSLGAAWLWGCAPVNSLPRSLQRRHTLFAALHPGAGPSSPHADAEALPAVARARGARPLGGLRRGRSAPLGGRGVRHGGHLRVWLQPREGMISYGETVLTPKSRAVAFISLLFG